MKYLYLTLTAFVMTFFGVNAQVNYTFSASSGTYTPLTGATSPPLTNAQAPYDTHDEGYANSIPLGFTFVYNGTAYTSISANTNGFASFATFTPISNPATQDYYTADLGYGPYGYPAVRPIIAPFWDDIDLYSNADLKYKTTGSAPNRVFTLEWGKVYWDASALQLNIEFQLKLYEGSNVIEFQYHQLPGALGNNPTTAIGITAAGTGAGNFIALSDASAAPIASSTTNYYNINTKPAEGQIYRFTPACNNDQTPPTIVTKDITIQADGNGNASIQPGDVIQNVTDNCAVDFSSITVSPNQFTCAAVDAPHQAYIANTTTGNHNWSGELGMEFTVNVSSGIVINQLGAFDHQGNGITGTRSGGIEVAIFDKNTHNVVPGLDAIIIGNADHYNANHRMKDIAPVTLPPGSYLIVAKGYNASELYGNELVYGSPYPTGDAASGAIGFVNIAYWSDNNIDGFSYPTHSMTLDAQPYIAGSFNYTVPGTGGGGSGGSGGGSGGDPTTPHQAYIANTNMGNHNWSGELGMEFTVSNPTGIVINQLGAFDHQGNGITGTRSGGIEVAIFDNNTHNIVPGLDAIVIGNSDHYSANHRMKDITPVTLPPGSYLVVAKGYNASELYGNTLVSGSPYPTGDAAGGAISFSGTAYWSDNNIDGFSYPTHTMALNPQPFIAGSFTYTVPSSGGGGGGGGGTPPPHQAYIANTNMGNHNWSGELGMEFTVNNPGGIVIDQLGAFDHQGNGITGTRAGGIEVAIFDKNTHNIVPGLDAVVIGNADHYSANHRMKNITPVTLPQGSYLVVAKGYNAAELYGNTLVSGSPYPTGDAAGGAISFSGTAYWSDNNVDGFSYPTHTMALDPQPFIAGTFNYTVPGSGTAPAGSNTYTVTVTASDMNGNTSHQTAKVTVTCNQPAPVTRVNAIEPPLALMPIKGPIKLFPNPSRGQFKVELQNLSAPKVTIQVLSLNGKMVTQKVVDLTGRTATLTVPFDLGNQAAGMYFIKVISADGVQTSKVVLQR